MSSRARSSEEQQQAKAAAKELRTLFDWWAWSEAKGRYDEPSLMEIQKALGEERERECYPRKPFPEG